MIRIRAAIRRPAGFTLIELLLYISLASAVVLLIAVLLSQAIQFFHRTQLQSQLNTDSRNCIDTMTRFLSNATPNSVIIQTPAPTGLTLPPPNSQIDFDIRNVTPNAHYSFYWSSQPANSVLMQVTVSGFARAPVVLASNVTSLSFTGDSRDPGSLSINLRLDAPWDGSGRPDHVLTMAVVNQIVSLQGNQ